MKIYCQNANCPRHDKMFREEIMKRDKTERYDFYFCSLSCRETFLKVNEDIESNFKKNYEVVKATTRKKHDKN